MSKSNSYVIFGDQSWPVESLVDALPEKSIIDGVWVFGKGWIQSSDRLVAMGVSQQKIKNAKANRESKEPPESVAKNMSWTERDVDLPVVIVGFQDGVQTRAVVDALKESGEGRLKILQVGSGRTKTEIRSQRRSIAWKDMLSDGLDAELTLLRVVDRVKALQRSLRDAERVALLLQDDPDPDGLAAALALRKVLGRNSQTAPIVTFGRITRPENLSMARLLEIEVETVRYDELGAYEKVVLVDCQPSFFKGREILADVILDHHPRSPDLEASSLDFVEIREDLGAISTLLTQYLRACDVDVSTRLATALLYGIKSDTLHLNRQVSEADLEAFVYLYPRVNSNVLRRIERPELPMKYLKALSRGLKALTVSRGVSVLPLGQVEREEWIAQAADFALQAEGAEWSMGCGVVDGRVVISARNCGYVQHAGDMFKELFNVMGCAGGHRTMAKAIVNADVWVEHFGERSLSASGMSRVLSKEIQRWVESSAPSSVDASN